MTVDAHLDGVLSVLTKFEPKAVGVGRANPEAVAGAVGYVICADALANNDDTCSRSRYLF